MAKKIIVKSDRKKEAFSEKKLYKSIHDACLSAQVPKKECETLTKRIYKDVLKLIKQQHCLLSEEVASHVANVMHKRKKELAVMYKGHKNIS